MGFLRAIFGSRNDPPNAELDELGKIFANVLTERMESALDFVESAKAAADTASQVGGVLAELQRVRGVSDFGVSRVLSATDLELRRRGMRQGELAWKFTEKWLVSVRDSWRHQLSAPTLQPPAAIPGQGAALQPSVWARAEAAGDLDEYVQTLCSSNEGQVARLLYAASVARVFLEERGDDEPFPVAVLEMQAPLDDTTRAKIASFAARLPTLRRQLMEARGQFEMTKTICMGLVVWEMTLRSLISPELLSRGRAIWKELARGESKAASVLAHVRASGNTNSHVSAEAQRVYVRTTQQLQHPPAIMVEM